MDIDEIKADIKKLIADELHIPLEKIKDEDTFHDIGLDSITATFILDEIENKYEIDIKPMDVWNHPTLGSFSELLHRIINESH